ncbi:basic salivary proline-rich protein 1-like isoform X1 [Canis lupus familiaris]|uniref:basic salivary proline-rich protein 1-like isoform X1 n=1 Tax=Canis lupus familiaris TaxID=9615 RepID=UPI0018F5E29F|nr:basic salivary proline-rich protein 1-like isoform X1 [Canis lupus familiaris]
MIGGSTTAISPPPPPPPPPSPRPPGQDGGKRPPGRTPCPLPLAAVQPPARSPGNPGTAAGARAGSGEAGGGREEGATTPPFVSSRRTPRDPETARSRAPAGGPGPPGRPLAAESGDTGPGASSGRGEGERPPSPLQRRGGRPREEGGRSAGGPRTPNSASRATQPVAERSLTQLPEGNTRPRGRGKPFPAPLHTAAARPTFRFFQQLRNWGAFMAPREEDSQAERMSPLRHPFLSPSPLTHTHTHNLNSSPAVAAQPPAPLRPPGCRLLTPQAPTFSQYTSPPPPFGSGGRPPPLQCGNVPAAPTGSSNRQSGAEADARPGQ